jgi:dihydrodipicolinate synthase/N-acetylneuraminate lyase
MTESWRGIMPIVATPFGDDYALDEAGLRRLVDFCIAAGATGLVGPANASEFSTLSDDERRRWIEIVVAAARGQVPVVASITSGHAVPAVDLARFAQDAGAAGVMSMPPHVLRVDQDGCYDFYRQLSQAVDIPICIQNFDAPVGTPMSGELLGRMCRELPGVDYIKEETVPEPRQVSRTLKVAGEACKGVLGGKGGIYLLDEYRRGSCGNMPGCHTTDAIAAIWENLEAGDEAQARRLFYQILPLMNYERLYGIAVYKWILQRRGLIESTRCRAPAAVLDADDLRELEIIMADVEPLFRV